jgi:hypothetical protein
MKLLLGVALSAWAWPAFSQSPTERLRADVHFLADDSLEGRGTPGRGLDAAALYLETQLRLAGVLPASPEGYRQWYRMGEYVPAKARITVRIAGRSLPPAGFVFINFGRDPAPGPIDCELVNAGFGVVAEERKVNELEGLDLRGKAILARKGAGWTLDPTAVFGPDRAMGKILASTARGANLLLYVTPDLAYPGADAEAGFFAQMKAAPVGFVREPGLGPGGQPASALSPVLLVTPQALAAALGAPPEKLPRGPLGKRVAIGIDAPIRDGRASNVVGRIEGTDPALREQWVVLTAHYDHVGSQEVPSGQDGIWNGADDNASGSAAVLEMARRLAASAPKRSVLILLTSGEDRGLLGSAFYALRPAVPMDRVVANVNLDMIGRSQGQVQAIAHGAPALFDKAVELGRAHSLQVVEDQQPLWRVSYLIDSYHFLRFNVPAVFFFTGVHPDYHQPTDTADKIRYAEMARLVDLATALTRHLADGAAKPEFRRPAWFLTP